MYYVNIGIPISNVCVCIVYNAWCKICSYCWKLTDHGSYGGALGQIFIFSDIEKGER